MEHAWKTAPASLRRSVPAPAEQAPAAEAIRILNARLSADLSAMTRMQEISTRLVQAEDFAELLDEIVAAGTEISGADMGNIQLFQNGVLQIVSHRHLGGLSAWGSSKKDQLCNAKGAVCVG